ncbi:hypothetical protein [uncultured Ruminococcus sp.]|uniref:hypothetical protein n=1 Tax=uncultured Ruminococcus sp. TaxID=165186 RepID=UPI00293007B2|nr:hypothetical protein [uncultured Ruminococcus sp.]
MKFPNAAKGVKRIFTAEILGLISTILLIIGFVLLIPAVLVAKNGAEGLEGAAIGATVAMGVFVLIAGVLSIIAFIMNIIGISNASKDEENFKSALLFLILGLVAKAASITIGRFVKDAAVATGMLDSASSLLNIFVTIFVISGIVKLADRLNRGDISAKGTNVLKILIAVNVLSLIASFVASVMGGPVASGVSLVLAIVSAVLSLVQYIMYLSLLGKAKKMLIES